MRQGCYNRIYSNMYKHDKHYIVLVIHTHLRVLSDLLANPKNTNIKGYRLLLSLNNLRLRLQPWSVLKVLWDETKKVDVYICRDAKPTYVNSIRETCFHTIRYIILNTIFLVLCESISRRVIWQQDFVTKYQLSGAYLFSRFLYFNNTSMDKKGWFWSTLMIARSSKYHGSTLKKICCDYNCEK